MKQRKPWGHIMGTAIRPPLPRTVIVAVAARVASPGVDAVAGVTGVTQGMVVRMLDMIEIDKHQHKH